jgi:hypothetical protein
MLAAKTGFNIGLDETSPFPQRSRSNLWSWLILMLRLLSRLVWYVGFWREILSLLFDELGYGKEEFDMGVVAQVAKGF